MYKTCVLGQKGASAARLKLGETVMDSDRDGQSNSPPSEGAPAPIKWGVATRLWLGFGALIALLLLTDFVSYRYTLRITGDLRQIVEIEEPLEEAVLEMEINAGETALAVLDYVRDQEPKHLETIRDAESDYEQYALQYQRLAETDEERRLGKEVARLYEEFSTLGSEIVFLARQRNVDLLAFQRVTLMIDQLLDTKLRRSVERDTPDPKEMEKQKLADDMDEIIDENFPSILIYLAVQNPAMREEFEDAEADVKHLEALYRQLGLSEEETGLLDQFDRDFTEAVAAGNRIVDATDELNQKLELFERDHATIDAILDDQIQPLIHAETIKAAADAENSMDQVSVFLVVITIAGVFLGVGAAWASSRTILAPL